MSGYCMNHRLEMLSHALPVAKEYQRNMPDVPENVVLRLAQASVRSKQLVETMQLKFSIAHGLPI